MGITTLRIRRAAGIAAGLGVAGLLTIGIALAAAHERWYSAEQVRAGRAIYAENCASCHGRDGEGQPDWDQRDSLGFYPAPPLNKDGHAWHHSLADMLQALETGGGPNGGTMPSFVDVIDEAGKHAVLAYMQSLWPEEIYAAWAAIDRGAQDAPSVTEHH